MFLLTIVANTTSEHPEHGKVGDAYVACWIDRHEEEDAIAVACDMIALDGWDVVRVEEVSFVTEADYDEDDEYRMYYEQALSDKEVLVFHLCPLFPVFCLSFEVRPASEGETACEARVWVANESVDDNYDPMALDFWSGERLERAITLAKDAIEESGYRTVRLLDQYPCRRDETSEDCQFYDDAEENGLCIVFIHEQDDACDAVDH